MIMLLFLIIQFSRNIENDDESFQCIAPLRTPPPIKGMKPIFSAVILRHGSRTPQISYSPAERRGYWVCDSEDSVSPRMYASSLSSFRRFQRVIDPRHVEFSPNCRSGDLLIEGMEQHKRLGQMYHDYLYRTLQLFDEPPKESEVFARSTDFERTFRSCQAFLNGAFPPQSPFEFMTIVHGSDYTEILRPGSFCKDQLNVSEAYRSDPEVLAYAQKEWKKLEHISKPLQLTFSITNLTLLADWIYTYHCNDRRLPSYVTNEDMIKSHKILGKLFSRYYKGNGLVYASYSMREVLRIVEQSINQYKNDKKDRLKFAVFSAHDSTLSGFISFFNLSLKLLPPYASHILVDIFELNREICIRWSYNGEIISLKEFGGNENYAKYSEFLKKVHGIYDVCKELP